MSEEPKPKGKKLTLGQEMGSVLASFFGVQSRKNRERDFTHGNARRFVVLGLVFTLLFVLTVAGIVKLVMRNAGL